MKTFQHRGYDIQPDCPYFDDMRRWGVRCLIRRQGKVGQQPVPATTRDFFANQDDAIAVGMRRAKAMIDNHLDGRTGDLADLDRF
ncbi:hypothetical protein RSSE_c3298 [Ralstonia solanacearum]|nr:hypothetical protein RSSE_c3298 [Ralstonia solanacearum]